MLLLTWPPRIWGNNLNCLLLTTSVSSLKVTSFSPLSSFQSFITLLLYCDLRGRGRRSFFVWASVKQIVDARTQSGKCIARIRTWTLLLTNETRRGWVDCELFGGAGGKKKPPGKRSTSSLCSLASERIWMFLRSLASVGSIPAPRSSPMKWHSHGCDRGMSIFVSSSRLNYFWLLRPANPSQKVSSCRDFYFCSRVEKLRSAACVETTSGNGKL